MIALVALAAAASFGQQIPSFHTTAHGLPSADVQSVVAAPDGFVYARTAAGAARFADGRWIAVADAPMVKRSAVELPTRDGIPVSTVTAVERAPDGSYWAATPKGALRWDGKVWEYRAGPRWLPDDEVRSVAVQGARAFFATRKGVAVIETRPMTYAEKAAHFEREIDKRHRRTEYGYVIGTPENGQPSDSDNDGLWTAMYGAGECYACAMQVEGACERARRAFEALRFLRVVTEGTAPAGFVARAILPTSGPDPNVGDSPERDRKMKATRDPHWKVISPRWPRSKDGKWYWKSDTSSDELDGHYYFYGLYYDLVAKTADEKARVREHVAAITDHLVKHGFRYVDRDGQPTRWGIFDPANLNDNPQWEEERGLNSISIVAYLRTAEHITGKAEYAQAVRTLVDKHGYARNALLPKPPGGIGMGNHSDDEMAFMCLYNLLRYERDPKLRETWATVLRQRFVVEEPEASPLFDFMAAASLRQAPRESSFDTLRRFPLDRRNYAFRNSGREDVVLLPGESTRGHRKDGRVFPVDERFFEHWNHDPWRLDGGGDGRFIADGAAFLLPYYMGMHHGLLSPPADQVRLPYLIADGMVVQRDMPVHVWGAGTPGQSVAVSFRGESQTVRVDAIGRWSVRMKPGPAGGPFELRINSTTVRDVLVGDVWIAAGQSNMEWPVRWSAEPEKERAAANFPSIRLARTMHRVADHPLDEWVGQQWQPCSPESVEHFSAVAYHFARNMHDKHRVPIGIIQSAWGGTPIEAWTGLRGIAHDPGLMPAFAEWAKTTARWETERLRNPANKETSAQRRRPGGQWTPAGLYNAMIAPLTRMSIKGVIWYQGEANTSPERAPLYERFLPALIRDWREAWGQGDFPFLIVQLANYNAVEESMWPTVRDAQRKALGLANTSLVVMIDIGEAADIHPKNKREVGRRLALAADGITSPLIRMAHRDRAAVRLWFTGSSLASRGPLTGFEAAGEDGRWVPADARIDSGTILVSSKVEDPKWVRYAWSANPTATLFDTAGLPASPFRIEVLP